MVDSVIRLFPETATTFLSNGLGYLPDATSCEVTEKRNDSFELSLKYPITGLRYKELKLRRLLLVKTNPYGSPQAFRIYSISRPFNGIVTVNASHISYDMSGIPVAAFSSNTLKEALEKIKNNVITSCPFTFWTDKEIENYFLIDAPNSIKYVLGGANPSLIEAYGGELEFDNFDVKIHEQRGKDIGYPIRYGKNLTDLTQEEDNTNVYTGIYPYWYNEEKGLVEANPKIVPVVEGADYEKIYILDCTQDFSDPPKSEDLKKKAEEYISENELVDSKTSLTVSFVELSKSTEYENFKIFEEIKLCDIVTIMYEKLGIDAKLKCIETVYNVLTDRYDSIVLGAPSTTLAKTIVKNKQDASNDLSNSISYSEGQTNKKIENIVQEIHLDLREVVTKFDEDLNKTTTEFETQLNITARGLDTRITEVSNTVSHEIEGLDQELDLAKQEFSNEIEATARRFSVELRETNETLTAVSGRVDTLSGDVELEFEKTKQEFSNEIEATARQFSVNLQQVNSTLKGDIETVNEELNSKIESTARGIELSASRTYATKEYTKAQLKIANDKIETKVSNGEVSSAISQEAGGIDIEGDRFTLNSSKLDITAEGDIWTIGIVRSTNADGSAELVLEDGFVSMIKDGTSAGRFAARPGYNGVEMIGNIIAAVGTYKGAGYVVNDAGDYFNTFYGSTIFINNVRVNGTFVTNSDAGVYGNFAVNGQSWFYGTGEFAGNVTAPEFVKSSLLSMKENLSPITEEEALKIMDVVPYHFDYINGAKNKAGFIVDWVEPVFQDCCAYKIDKEGNKTLQGIDYSSFIPYVFKMLQMLKQDNDYLKECVAKLMERT